MARTGAVGERGNLIVRILAVDDDAAICELIPLVLAQLGHLDVVVMNSGYDAMESVGSRSGGCVYDCILLDIQMPEMDGIELCERLRRLPAYRKTPIIMLTAMTEKAYIDKAFAAGATDYVTKPFDFVELGARLRVAEQLIAARSGVGVENAASARDPEESRVNMSLDIQIDGVSGMIEFQSFQNYLSHLSHSSLLSVQVLAVSICSIERISMRATPDEFRYALTEVAFVISDVLARYGGLMAYAGKGVFVCISGHPESIPSTQFESEIDYLLDERETFYDDGTPLDLEVSVGNPIRPNSATIPNIRQMLDRAIARAQARLGEKRERQKAPSVRRVKIG